MRVVLAQLNFTVGDIERNTQQILDAARQAIATQQADLVIFPELCITGYPPEDLLFRDQLYERVDAALQTLRDANLSAAMVVGYPAQTDKRFNEAAVIHQGRIIAQAKKQHLPSYEVFDEHRYFTPGSATCVFDFMGHRIALLICEDLWHTAAAQSATEQGADLLVSINASPFSIDKEHDREQALAARQADTRCPIIYVNHVGGQDEVVYDGCSRYFYQGQTLLSAPTFSAGLFLLVLDKALAPTTPTPSDSHKRANTTHLSAPLPAHREEHNTHALIYNALVLGVKDYVEKNGFPGALLGLSGGIDSALTLAIAVDALGSDRVEAVLMPSAYTSDMSNTDALAEAESLGIKHSVLPIAQVQTSFLETLSDRFENTQPDTTEENLQARIRGTLLMALSNKFGALVLTTGNKSELAVGYSTLYGDMAGGFCVLKDVPKTRVYELARYRNERDETPVIPQRVIDRAPSAELAPDQTDQDNLPPYDVLDDIIYRYVDGDESVANICASGHDEATVNKVVRLINRNEYKRRQSPPGVRISRRAFGKDRRYPITSKFYQ